MSADILDQAQELSETMLQISINNQRRLAAGLVIQGSGVCQVCANEVEPILCGGKLIVGRWCSTECRSRADL